MAIDDGDRDHLYETLRQQYDPDDARTLITLLGYSANPEDLATKLDLLALARQADLDELRRDVADLKTDMGSLRSDMADLKLDFAQLGEGVKDVVIEQSCTHQHWMFGLLTVYTAMAGTLVAIGAILIS